VTYLCSRAFRLRGGAFYLADKNAVVVFRDRVLSRDRGWDLGVRLSRRSALDAQGVT
jgi:hypothetical protein